ncbi:MAG: hypothetical protein JXR96_24590 [Deltaproteobacteria bacterium]|nr:hypothetical protein [Deltaproteobacteria bacterium]
MSGEKSRYTGNGQCWPFEKKGVNHQVREMRFTPDGKRACVCGDVFDNLVLSERGKKRATFDVEVAHCLDVDPSGTRAALGGGWAMLSLHDLQSGKRLAEVTDPLREVEEEGQVSWCRDEVLGVRFSPGGGEIAWSSSTGAAYISEAGSLAIKRQTRLDEGRGVPGLLWHPEGSRLLAASSKQLCWLDVRSLKTLECRPWKGVRCLALSRDGARIAVGLEGEIRLLDRELGVLPERLKLEGAPGCLLFSHEGDGVFAAMPKAVLFWDISEPRAAELRTADKREDGLLALALHPKSKRLFCAGSRGIHFWEPERASGAARVGKARAGKAAKPGGAPLAEALRAFDLSMREIVAELGGKRSRKRTRARSEKGKPAWGLDRYALHPQVEEYLAGLAGIASLRGPFYLSAGRLRPVEYSAVFDRDLGFGRVMPALPIGHHDGHEFLLMIESARVVTVHHDLWPEIGRAIRAGDEKRFLARFQKKYTVLDLHELLALQLALHLLGISSLGNVPDELAGDVRRIVGRAVGRRSLGTAAWAGSYYATLGFLRKFYDPRGEI